MKFFVALVTLVSLAVAAPAPDVDALTSVPVEREGIVARQVYGQCYKIGEYACYANIADRNDMFEYIGQCGTDGRIHVRISLPSLIFAVCFRS